jgi:hypothetical protein
MPRRDQLAAKLIEVGYKHYEENAHFSSYRRGHHHVHVPRADSLSDDYVIAVLRTCGISEATIAMFLASCR